MRSAAVICAALWCAVALAQQPWQADKFPIGAWGGPPPSMNTIENMRIVAEGNFNIVGPTGGYRIEQNLEMLDYCQQAGIRAMLIDSRISGQMVTGEGWQAQIGEVVSDYAGHPATYGYYLRDEPNSLDFDPLGQISREFERQDPAHLPFINLFPTYANTDQLGAPNYEDHLTRFMQSVTPMVISYDHYALRKDGSIRPDYYENMELARAASLRTGIPWWFVHNSGAYAGYRDPTEAEMRWQVYTSLAYGTKGIMYWHYWARTQTDPNRSGVVDAEGKPTRLYAILQKLNAETQVLGDILLPMTCTDVLHVGDVPAGGRRLGTDAILQLPEDQPLMVGLFRAEDGTQYAMIANRDHANAVDFEVTFLRHVVGVARISAQDGSATDLAMEGRTVALSLPAGDGALLQLTTEFDYPRPPEMLSAIDFQFNTDGDMEGWGNLGGLSGEKVADGVLTMALGTRDPHMARAYMTVAADTYAALRVRMRVVGGDPAGQVFWLTRAEPGFADTRYMNFPTQPDGEWHEYEIPVSEHERWAGQEIRGIRLDPSTGGAEPGAQVQIDWIIGVPKG